MADIHTRARAGYPSPCSVYNCVCGNFHHPVPVLEVNTRTGESPPNAQPGSVRRHSMGKPKPALQDEACRCGHARRDHRNEPYPYALCLDDACLCKYFVKAEAQGPASDGTKHDAEKPRWDLLPFAAVSAVVDVLTFGAKKYAPDNWRTVPEARRRYTAAALRHTVAWWRGERVDAESGLPHLAHAACCLLFLAELDEPETSNKKGTE
jgi:hypothetical protein